MPEQVEQDQDQISPANIAVRALNSILLVEDNPGDARLLREILNEHTLHNIELTHVEYMRDAEAFLAGNEVDIVLLDLGLPDAQGLDAVRRAHACAPTVPLVVLTNLDDESLAMQALQAGAQDYLVKGQIETFGLVRTLRYAVERKRTEGAAKAMALEMAHSAEHDALTGLPNRTFLNDRLRQAIAGAPRYGKKVAVLYLDLDGFKTINNSLGHPVGDMLLQSVASRLVGCVRGGDTVSRQSGDEFVVLLSELEQPDEAAVTARRMLESVARPHCVGEHELHISASIGISIFPEDGENAETLIKNADTAMYQSKEYGRQGYKFFKPTMNAKAVERQSLEEGLRRALDRHEFELHYQPKIDLKTGAIAGAEALIRWTHPTRGTVSPAQFIPVAEDSGLILPIGAWVMRQACTQAKAWADAGLPRITIAVNVSPIEFREKNFLEGAFTILAETGLAPELLELELTESVLMKRAAAAAAMLQTLRERGVQVAIDDFGTGYSNLSYLQKFPVDCLKIDQSFIRQLGESGQGTRLVAAMIGMARALDLRVVAEGVETLDELVFLRSQDCDQGQGYHFSRPVPAEQFAELLRSGIPEQAPVAGANGAAPARIELPAAAVTQDASAFDIDAGVSWTNKPFTQAALSDERRVFLSRQLAGSREIRLALVAVLISAIGFVIALPFATMPLAPMVAFIPAYQSALVICDLITAVLLFSQFNVLRSRALIVLACGYLFTAFIAFGHALTFPGLFSPTGLFGSGPQSTVWLYMFWHAGFPLFVIAYAVLKDQLRLDRVAIAVSKGNSATVPILASIAGVCASVALLMMLATKGHDLLSVLIIDNRFTPTMTVVVSGIWMISLIALVMLWSRQPRTVLDLWLMVVMCAWLFDIALSAVLNAARYDVGWYGGRIYGLMAASFLLIVLQIENGTYYARLAKLSTDLSRLSRHDGLTGLANRRFFDAFLNDQIAIARRNKSSLALILCDVDAFKAFNDRYGHQAGDECLRLIAAALQTSCRRPADMAARYGGEEFALVLPDTDLAGAIQIAEAARRAVASMKMPHPDSPAGPNVSISGGVAVLLSTRDLSAQELITAADGKLFEAKQRGRDRMVAVEAEAA